jgi:PD-(D/E)XK endonuclease
MQIENHEYDCDRGRGSEQQFEIPGFDIQAIGLDTRKSHGEVAEAKFLAKASSMGFGVARPWGEERYDLILDSGYCLWRVQVKSTQSCESRGYQAIIASCVLAPYDETQIDFLVAYLVPEDAWYVIPVKMLKGRNSLHFCPGGRGKSKWEKYREGWCQMACPYDETGPGKIVTLRCRDKGPVQMAICPLKVLR